MNKREKGSLRCVPIPCNKDGLEIIGLLGHQGVGKNYIAEHIIPKVLKTTKNTVVIAFADHLKINCITKQGADYNKVYGEKDYETRKMLQREGTEEGRDKYGKDIWIKTMESWIKVLSSRGVKRFIISDVRFANEVKWIHSVYGLVMKINAPTRYHKRLMDETGGDDEKISMLKKHPSERDIDNINIDVEYTDWGKQMLYEKDVIINNEPGNDPSEDVASAYNKWVWDEDVCD